MAESAPEPATKKAKKSIEGRPKNEVQVKQGSKMSHLFSYAEQLLQDQSVASPKVVLVARDKAICKAVSLAELLKRKCKQNLVQTTSIERVDGSSSQINIQLTSAVK